MIITIKCIECKVIHKIQVTQQEMNDFQAGEKMIQDCFPSMNRSICEMFVSQICPECWDEMFKEKA